MKVKRRTVWLLTLLSLAAVISVYYVFEPNRNVDLMTIFTDDTLEETTLTNADEKLTTPTVSESHLFEDLRMEIANERSQLREQLEQKIASSEYSAEEKNEAYNQMNELIKRESAEAMLEMLIENLGYSDALVHVKDDKVQVTVLSDEISKAQASEIIYVVRQQIDDIQDVTVSVQSNYY
ncbi:MULTISPECIES: SpoIIIAH-like family protein [Ureibacillus]|jgi:stage III sporulation protein AH|uniref:Stage III sporulation protein AH n=1 Tax=Ureibacillus thermosphaericus TaxID=51173 RepID=A0A840Q148_URETH|nr:SpoIIIAH-like family protein [Ureibacillus thermosphaericus]MBB5148786.1 stage III sporulation protein AH [Ureibacillus thermosphaericus]NKZ31564.1 SpoIIIAH-like family protein [Ureibacillus thermosphaericus]